ncbi:MAG: helix-turn-helix domain-containing protein [Sphingomonadaceae bacterium]
MHAISLAQARAARDGFAAASCHTCEARQRCLPDGADGVLLERLERSVQRRMRVGRHDALYRRGEPCSELFAIHAGQFKTQRSAPSGASQVLGFYMPGELLGLEALDRGQYGCDAVALTDSVVCVLPYAALARLLGQESRLQHQFHHLMSSEIARQQGAMLMLGNARAPQRLAAFLLEQSARCQLRGESGEQFQLRMSREDIAAYLGLTVESISRLLSAFRRSGAVRVSNRAIDLLAPDQLRQIVSQTETARDTL